MYCVLADSRGAAAGAESGEDDEGSSEGRAQNQRTEPQRGPRGPDLQVGTISNHRTVTANKPWSCFISCEKRTI